MILKETVETPVSDAQLIKAIELRCSECFPAMNIANALGGYPSIEWKIVREFSLVDMVREANKRGIDLAGRKAAVGDQLVTERPIYQEAIKILSEEGEDEQ
jgi:hypothetical protein